jgi:hypothetical protein
LLIPSAGLQLIPAVLVVTTLCCLVMGKPAWGRAASLVAGTGAGAVGLWMFYRSHGVWQGFRTSTSAIGLIGQSVGTKLRVLPAVYTRDKSEVMLALLLLALLGVGWSSLPSRSRRVAAFCILLMAGLPAGLHLCGKFPIYYGWMVFLPLVITVVHLASVEWQASGASLRWVIVGGLAAACLWGLPLRTAGIAAAWEDRDPRRVSDFLHANLAPGEIALTDFKTYYGVWQNGSRPLLPTYLPAIRPEEKARVTVLVVRESEASPILAAMGGSWRRTGAVLQPARSPSWSKRLMAELRDEDYALVVFRRPSP